MSILSIVLSRAKWEYSPRTTLRTPTERDGHQMVNVNQLTYNFLDAILRANKMAANNALVQTRISPDIRDKAAAVLEGLGLTVSDVMRILLTRIANEGNVPIELTLKPADYDAWFRSKVLEAVRDTQPPVSHQQVEEMFSKKRSGVSKALNRR